VLRFSALRLRVFAPLRLIFFVSLCYVFSACIPADTPPQLAHTPGTPVVITQDRVEAAHFSAVYPPGWRVITSPAELDSSLIFAAPDNCALIILATTPINPPDLADCPGESISSEMQSIEMGTDTIYTALIVSAESQAAVTPIFNRVLESIE
jgi:hypothetical protein